MPLTGAVNFRDLGGYRTLDGRMVRRSHLYRSDTLHALTESDLAIVQELKLRSIIDLRTTSEVETTGRGPLQDRPIAYFHLSVIQEGITRESSPLPPLPELDLATLYLRWLDSSPEAFLEALTTLASPESYPVVFHCAAGKDRTGVLAAIVLDILGVAHDVIAEDYALTEAHLDAILLRQRANPETAQRMIDAPQLFTAEAQTMETFLGDLYARYGSARHWALAAGIAPDSLASLQAILIEPG